MTTRELCSVPSAPGWWITPEGVLTQDPGEADTYLPATSEATTWRPPPPAVPLDAGRYSRISRPTAEDAQEVLAFAVRRLRPTPALRAVLESLLRAMLPEESL